MDEAAHRLGHCAKAVGRGLNTRIHAIGDGAKWIELRVEEVFGIDGGDVPPNLRQISVDDFAHIDLERAPRLTGARPRAILSPRCPTIRAPTASLRVATSTSRIPSIVR